MQTTPHFQKRLRIGIDAHALGSNLGGNETYLRSLLLGLQNHPEHDYVLYICKPDAIRIAKDLLPSATCRLVSQNPLRRLGLDLLWASRFHGLDVMHLQYVVPLFPGCPISLLIHDLSYEHNPEWFTPFEVRRFRATIPFSAKIAKIVLTISKFCKEDIVRRLKMPPDKIKVTPNALPPFYAPASQEKITSLREKLALPEKFFLALGNLQPRKNIPTLLRSWKSIKDNPDIKNHWLVITGKKAWLYDKILQEAGVFEGSPSKERICFTGYLPEEDLPLLYSGAEIFIYPSLFEGFGLPPIEAMACGTPVIIGKNSALAEVCGEAACYTDVTSINQLASTILKLTQDENERARLSELGLERVRNFTLESLTIPTVEAWEAIVR